MLVGVQINVIGLKCELPENTVELLIPVNGFDSGHCSGLFFRVLLPLPQGDLVIGFFEEQHLPVLFFFSIRADYQAAVLLIDAAQIKQIRLLDKRMIAVGTGGHKVIGIEDGDGIGLQRPGQPPAVFNEHSLIDR